MTSILPDNDPAPPVILEPDAHGQAALLLAESILHGLIEKSALSLQEAIEVVRTAAEVKVEVAELAGESRRRMEESLALLSAIEASLTSEDSRFDAAAPTPR